jgi:hypothetical protein
VLQGVRDAATDVFGSVRTGALMARLPAPTMTADEATLILDRIERTVAGRTDWSRWIMLIGGANTLYSLFENVVKLLQHIS